MRSKSLFSLSALLVLVLAPCAPCAPKYKVLHAFTGGSEGGGLWGSLLLDAEGNVYGATTGTVFELSPQADGRWRLTTLHRFHYPGKGGSGLTDGLIFDPAGNLYGTASVGGAGHYGTVFRLTPGADKWAETVLYNFGPGPPRSPYAGVIMDESGNLYGTAGYAFELSPGSDGWTESTLHEFCQGDDGCDAYAGVILDPAGNLYGTTEHGGNSRNCGGGCGTAYQLHPMPDGSWEEIILHSFSAQDDGAFPGVGALVLDKSGDLYGTADGGNTGYGVIFKLSPGTDGRWKETVLYNVLGGANGDHPSAGVVRDESGNLFGTTIAGGPSGCGVVYKLAPQAKGKWKYTVLHSLAGYDGCQPDANLILDSKGNLYGTTAAGGAGGAGVAFEVTP